MSEPMLLFETDPKLGTPVLTAFNGAGKNWSQKDLHQLEDQLRSRYEVLVREGDGILDFKGQKLHVKKKEGDTSRQPTLELWLAEPSTHRQTAGGPRRPSPPTPSADWGTAFLGEIDRLFASPAFGVVSPVEKAMLRLVRDELHGLAEKLPPAEFALLTLISILITAEQVSRTQRPGEPHPYAYALSGVERLVSESSVHPRTPWGDLSITPNSAQPPSWLGRVWTLLTGAS